MPAETLRDLLTNFTYASSKYAVGDRLGPPKRLQPHHIEDMEALLAEHFARLDQLEHLMVYLDDWWSNGKPILVVLDTPESGHAHLRCFVNHQGDDVLVVGVGESLSDALLSLLDNEDGHVPPPPPGYYDRED